MRADQPHPSDSAPPREPRRDPACLNSSQPAAPVNPRRLLPALFGSDSPHADSPLDALLDDLEKRWNQGENPRAEDYIPLLDSANPDELLELAYREFCLAEANSQPPDPDAFLARFPQVRDRLARLIGLHHALDDPQLAHWFLGESSTPLPHAGDTIGPYLLERQLGRGGLARVFLARQTDLDHRHVVLKVSRKPSLEPRLLARARHPHIVEVLAHAATADESLFLLCMPFLGGASLADILPAISRRHDGADFLQALHHASAPELDHQATYSLAQTLITSLDFPRAIAWLIARLAEALHSAWQRGITHGDLKPANILITASAVPMLLDFNLAVDWSQPAGLPPETGGTLAYMAPERLRILAQPDPTRKPPRARDRHVADLYSLGLVLLECLTGHLPALPPTTGLDTRAFAARLAQIRERPTSLPRAVPHSLKPILQRLLEPNPALRYTSGADLAADLDRWRTGLDPLHAVPTSGLARLRILVPRLLTRARTVALPAAVLALGLLLIAGWIRALSHGRDQAQAAYARILSGREPDVFRFHRLPAWNDLDSSRPALAATRFLERYNVLAPGDWRAAPLVRHLPQPDRADLHAWILEQAYRLAHDLGLPANPQAEQERALAVIRQVHDGPLPEAFLRLESQILAQLGRLSPQHSASPTPAPPWLNLYIEALHAELIGNTKHAWDLYQQSRRLQPQAFWPRYRAAVMAYRLGWFREAADDLRVCIQHAPHNAALHAQLAGCLFELKQISEAVQACDYAVTLDPDLASILTFKLRIRKSQNSATTLLKDLDQLTRLTNWNDQASPWLLRLEILEASGVPVPVDSDSELSWRNLMDQTGNAEVAFLTGLRYLQIDQPNQAKACFERALRLHPQHLPARMFLADSLALGEQYDKSLKLYSAVIRDRRFDELIGIYPYACRVLHHIAQSLHNSPAGKTPNPALRERAWKLIDYALDHSSHSQAMRAETYYTKAVMLCAEHREGNNRLEAIRVALSEAWRLDPDALQLKERYRNATIFDPVRRELDQTLNRLPESRPLDTDNPRQPVPSPSHLSKSHAPTLRNQPGPPGPVGK